MNWLTRLSKKPMPLPVMYTHDDETGEGALRIDEVMNQETSNQLTSQFPNMKYLGSGMDGIAYETSKSVIKITNIQQEFENAILSYQNNFDWTVPIFSQPHQIQTTPPLWVIEMKKLKTLEKVDERRLVNYLTWSSLPEFPKFSKVSEYFSLDIKHDVLLNLYNQLKYIVESNKNSLWLTDIHGGNVGWDEDGKLKVFDFG